MSDGITIKNDGITIKNTGDESKSIQELNLRAYSACAVCPNCGKVGFSKSEQKINVLNMVFCCCGGCWGCHQILKKKSLNCYDADHHCAGCNHLLASYKAC